MSDSLIGAVVDGRYVITASQGRGGMASVYRARDKRLERDVAVKLMHPHLAEQANFTERFNREARAAAGMSSPYIVSVYDQGVWMAPNGRHAYLVMEYVPGPDVRAELSRLGSFNLGTALALTEQILRALAEAHSRGIVHRDVKPENTMLLSPLSPASVVDVPAIRAKVTDFGLARAATAEATATGQMLGTVAYIAPEIVTEGTASERSDIYAVGIMLYEFLTGKLPFTAPTPIATAYKHINSPMPRVGEQAQWLPPSVDSFISLLTAKDPQDRPADAQAALDELLALMKTIPEEDFIRRIPVIPVPRTVPVEPTAVDIGTTTMVEEAGLPVTRELAVAAPRPSVHSPQEDPEDPPRITPALPADGALADDDATVAVATRPRRKRRGRIALVVLALLAIIAGTVVWYLTAGPGKRIKVPEVAGSSYSEAVATLEAAGFTTQKQESYSDTVPTDAVISTDPAGGKSVHPKTPVVITVSLGIEQVSVPSLESATQEEAENLLRTARLVANFSEEFSETVPAGVVISQSIPAGTAVDHDSVVEVVVSKGREPIDVPDVVGLHVNDATDAITVAGLEVSRSDAYSDDVPEGQVISQNPTEGTLYRGDSVSVVVSLGPEMIEVPSVVGMQKSEATRILEEAGFKVEVESLYGGYFGTVRFQDPMSPKQARKGSTVKISVV